MVSWQPAGCVYQVFLDRSGRAVWLYNGVGLDSGSRPFTMATPILDDVPEGFF